MAGINRNHPRVSGFSDRIARGLWVAVAIALVGIVVFVVPSAMIAQDAAKDRKEILVEVKEIVAETQAKAEAAKAKMEAAKAKLAKTEKVTAEEKAAANAEGAEDKKADDPIADKPEEKKEAAPVNPINNWIRGIFGGGQPKARIIPKNPQNAKPPGAIKDPANGDDAAQDRIDARAPFDPDMAKMLRQASIYMEEARTEGRSEKWSLALEVLKYVLDPERPHKGDQPVEDSLVRGENGEWTTMRREANRLLAEFPPEQLSIYREQYGALADVTWKKARQSGRVDQVVAVASQFFHTPAGAEAANWMGMRHFDHGEYGMAARWFRQLLDHNAPITRQPYWKIKAAVTFHQAGDEKTSQEILKQLEGSTIQLGQKSFSPTELVANLDSQHAERVPTLVDWPMLYGSASHLGKAQGGDPLLLSRWFQPLTNSQQTNESIEELVEDLNDEQNATVPAFTPIMVNGKVIFRTLRGVRVVDVESGRSLWETRAGISPESLMTGVRTPQPEYMQQMGFFGGNTVQQYSGNGANNNTITNLLFRNGVWGGISSDGEQLFVLEDHSILLNYRPENHWNFQNGITDPHRRDYSTNKIVSYDLRTGRPRWEIGGTAMDEPFDRRLAGYYFHGVPVADGNEIFAVGEKDNEIRMFALDRETGRPKWSQLVAYTDAKIERDFARRFWTAQVGVSQGVIVCPTTVGWLAGIDRLNHSVLWIQRYSKPQKKQPDYRNSSQDTNLVPSSTLNSVWGPSAPIISGHRVLYSPPEDPTLVCLDLFTGKTLWQKQKGDQLYVAGVFEKQAILVGKTSMVSISMESGSTLWTLPLSQEDGKPCGRGVAVGNLYHLPLSSGQLWSVDLVRGTVATKSQLPDGLSPLGNLGMYHGTMLSLSAKGLTAFAQKQAIEQEILARRKNDPKDAWATLFEANIQVLGKHYEPALKLLREVQVAKLSPDNQRRHRELVLETLTDLIVSDFQKRDAEYAELETFVKSDAEQLIFRRLTADRLRARGEYQSAFDEYLTLAETRGGELVRRDDDSRISLSLERWLGGRMEQLWRGVSADDRARLDERIVVLAEAAVSHGTLRSQRFLVLFGFHPSAVDVRRSLVEEFALAGEIGLAQNQLLKLTLSSDERISAMAWERMARLFRDRGLSRDADYYYQRLAETYPQVRLDNGKLVSQHIEELKAAKAIHSAAHVPITWSGLPIQELRSGSSYSYSNNQEHDLKYTPYRLPYLQDHRLRFFQQHHRLGITKAATDEIEWLVPLRTSVSHAQGNLIPAENSGHVLFVVHAGVLHALSPIDKKVLWTRPLETKTNQNYYYAQNSNANQPMIVDTSLNPYQWLQQEASIRSSLAVANSKTVCVLGRRMLTVLDSMTGEVLWTKDRLATQSKIYGTDSLVFIVPANTSQAMAYRSLDGQPVDVPDVAGLLQKALRVLPEGLILKESNAANSILGLTRGTTTVRSFDPLENRDHWKHEFPAKSYFSLMDDNDLVVLRPSGELDMLDLETGRLMTLAGASEEDLKGKTEVRVLTDHDNAYLIINKKRQGGQFFSSYNDGNMPSIPVNGLVLAWNRDTGKQLWKQDVKDQKLLLMHFTHSPLLVFTTQMYKRVDNQGFYYMRTLAIDKFTGKVKVDVSAPSNYSNFQSYELRLGEATLELRSYQSRLRMTALPPESAKAEKPLPAPAIAE